LDARKGLLILFAVIFATLAASSALAGEPTGASPNDPLMVPTDWQFLAPNTTLWFYFDYVTDTGGGGFGFFRAATTTRAQVNVALDAYGIGGMQFAIYTPEQANDWLRDPTTAPIGRGTPYRDTVSGEITRDLYWTGAFNTGGRYFITVTNNNPVAIPFRLTVTGDTVTLYPVPTPAPTPTLVVPFTVAPVPTGTIQGKIVFQTATGGLIYTVNGDGSDLTLLTYGIDPTWSPDGKQIAFARWGSTYPGLYIMNADGSKEQLIYGASRIRSPKWSPDGKYIAFTQDKPSADGKPLWKLGLIEIGKVIDADTIKNVLSEPQCSRLCYAPSWNSDSVTLAYTDPGVGIMTTSIISGSASLILGPQGTYFDAAAGIVRPILHMPPIQSTEWSPDGKRIVYSQRAHDRWELNVVSADGSNPVGITSPDPILYTLFGVTVHNVAPTWSPDGEQILFLSDRNGKWEFFVTDPRGSNIRQVLKNVTDRIFLRFDFENERMMDWVK
jgi:hypothetical protein